VGPIRARTREFLDDPGELTRIVHQGAEKARAAATSTLEAVYQKVGFLGD
jgi:tryptophanyl-tRNA synthetase